MKLVLLSDIHSRFPRSDKLEAELESADAVLISGDITGFGSYDEGEAIISHIQKFCKSVFAVGGNCDTGEIARMIEHLGVSVHGQAGFAEGLCITGVSGVERGRLPLNFYDILENSIAEKNCRSLAVISHEPAFGTERCGRSSSRKGNKNIRKFAENYKPVLAVSGHVHEAWGSQKIGSTVFINPGAWLEGRFATVTLDNNLEFSGAEFHS
ncbi:metallophosphoesterase family protein [Sedimentisphaera salicampi]|uniref:Phosphodiesterase n=1 Tax=Sedimentisphaera salicampi TaxID=1941349 RepID=A0A1W6LNY8_9BACT|nr:metallophosphoesterase [Sedimentisphaera salicampi]ARN57452.1 phosphodiesterase [Sedimentisphaera salicampi]OXU14468.1 phosphodiesterase [Sedimentisphaera salicampi]